MGDHNSQQKSQKSWKLENNHDKIFLQRPNNQNSVEKKNWNHDVENEAKHHGNDKKLCQ